MCGIAGLLGIDGRRPECELLERMIAVARHRGPDEQGIYVDGAAGLAHARLSIIDLEGGQQPMQLPEDGLCITFNGEIFNYLELRDELSARGRVFRTRSDTEVILHLYAEHGPAALERMNGQWGLAIWDARRGELFLARDRLGVRPVHFVEGNGFFGFASENKSLLELPWVRREVEPAALADILTFWHPLPPRTFFAGIEQLEPGCNMTVAAGSGRQVKRRYFALDYRPDERLSSEEAVAEELGGLLRDATRIRLRADVPVGAYLSGGLDSSSTAALVRETSDATLRSYSVAFDDPAFDEYDYQREVASHLGTDHGVVRCSHADISRVFPEVVCHAEVPIVRTAPAPLFLLSSLVRESGFKVVLTGEGSDEVLGGYDLFKEAKIRRFWGRQPESRLRPQLLRKLYPYMPAISSQPLEYLQAFFSVKVEDLTSPFFSHLPRWRLGARNAGFLSPELKARLVGRDALGELADALPSRFADWDPFCQAQYLETAYLLPGYILSSQGDRMAMAHAVEGRFPFLDPRVVELGARIPPRLKMKGLDEKFILKRAMSSLVPRRILRRSKQPYRAPDAASFFVDGGAPAAPYVAEMFSPASLEASGLFNPRAAAALYEKVCRSAGATSVKDNMAFVTILSAQILHARLIRRSWPFP